MTFPNNRRAEQRLRTALKGQIVINDRYSTVDCIVRDLSESGARLQTPEGYLPPRQFGFEIPTKARSANARTIWSSGNLHGIMFYDRGIRAKMAPLTEERASQLQQIVEDARRAIAQAIGVAPDVVKLTLELPPAGDAA